MMKIGQEVKNLCENPLVRLMVMLTVNIVNKNIVKSQIFQMLLRQMLLNHL